MSDKGTWNLIGDSLDGENRLVVVIQAAGRSVYVETIDRR